MTDSIRPYIPFIIVYLESFRTQLEATEKEKYFKLLPEEAFIRGRQASGSMPRRPRQLRVNDITGNDECAAIAKQEK